MSSDSPHYRRRYYVPALAVVVVLFVGAAVIWLPMLWPSSANSLACNAPGPAPVTTAPTTRSQSGTATASTTESGTPQGPGSPGPAAGSASPTASSPAPTTPIASASTPSSIATTLGMYTEHAALEAVRPANPATVKLQVFNASSIRGQAKAVTDELRAAGFESIEDSANDPLYPASDLNCVGQIRFGPAGAAAARTVLLVTPCAQLVVDSRVDDSVDLSLGGRYIYNSVTDEVLDRLKEIRDNAQPPAVIEGQTVEARPLPPIPPLPQTPCAF